MLKYLIIQLDDTSVSFCHYKNGNKQPHLIDISILKEALFWSMKENLIVQFIYPDYDLPCDYKAVISEVDHADIVSCKCEDTKLRNDADVVVFNAWTDLSNYDFIAEQAYVIRTTLSDLFANEKTLESVISKINRLNVVITDIENFDKQAQDEYTSYLDKLSQTIVDEYRGKHPVQLNIITDRMMLDSMNNCGAGDESVTLAPDGKLYICPGFYLDGSSPVGDVTSGLDVKNPQLYKLDHAPICRICDAWHCKRCIWLNNNLTLEVNTPGREQCVATHIERNASRKLLAKIRELGTFLPDKEIPEIDYLDPFEEAIKK